MDNNTNHSISAREVDQVQEHQQKLLQQNLSFIDKVARIEVQQEATKEQLNKLECQVSNLQTSLTEEIRTSVGGRMNDISNLLVQQQDTQTKIVEVQARQGEQIEEIRRTLEEFTKIQTVVSVHETRLNSLEQQISRLDDVDKTRVQGKWALITAVAGGLLGILGSLLAIFLK